MNKRKVQGSKVGKKERHSPYGFFLPGILIACTLKIFSFSTTDDKRLVEFVNNEEKPPKTS